MESKTAMERVILLHGLSRSANIMEEMEKYLHLHGYLVYNLDYPSTTTSTEKLTELVYQKIHKLAISQEHLLHFVGHSLGAIIIRCLLQRHAVARLGRVVMVGAPNQGSEVAQFLQRFHWYRKFYGPAGCQLGTHENLFLENLAHVDYPCGIIAGNKSTLIDRVLFRFLFQGDNDGKVSVHSTELTGMTDHLVLAGSHAKLPKTPEVMRQTAFFLAHGYFEQ